MEGNILIRSCLNSIYDNDFTGVDTITTKLLNNLTGHRTISTQEAVHDIAGLLLVLCSDTIVNLPLGAVTCLHARKNEPFEDIVGSYRCREEEYKGLSLEKYYYRYFVPERYTLTWIQRERNIVSWFQKD